MVTWLGGATQLVVATRQGVVHIWSGLQVPVQDLESVPTRGNVGWGGESSDAGLGTVSDSGGPFGFSPSAPGVILGPSVCSCVPLPPLSCYTLDFKTGSYK